MTSWHHNPRHKIHGWVWSAVFVHLMDGWLLIPGRFYTDAHTQAPLGQTGLWECFVFDRWQPKPSFHLSRCADMQRAFCAEQHRCRVNNSQSDSEKEQQRLALMSDVTYFQAEVGPHVQLNHLWLSKNFLPAKCIKTDEPRTYKWPPRGIFKIISFSAFKEMFVSPTAWSACTLDFITFSFCQKKKQCK